jgi:hypothetical protein
LKGQTLGSSGGVVCLATPGAFEEGAVRSDAIADDSKKRVYAGCLFQILVRHKPQFAEGMA